MWLIPRNTAWTFLLTPKMRTLYKRMIMSLNVSIHVHNLVVMYEANLEMLAYVHYFGTKVIRIAIAVLHAPIKMHLGFSSYVQNRMKTLHQPIGGAVVTCMYMHICTFIRKLGKPCNIPATNRSPADLSQFLGNILGTYSTRQYK